MRDLDYDGNRMPMLQPADQNIVHEVSGHPAKPMELSGSANRNFRDGL